MQERKNSLKATRSSEYQPLCLNFSLLSDFSFVAHPKSHRRTKLEIRKWKSEYEI